MNVISMNMGARERLAIVLDDADRHALVDTIADALGDSLLSYFVLTTHLHSDALAAGDPPRRLERALTRYARVFNARHGFGGALFRGSLDAREKSGPAEIARAIAYTHDDPVRTKTPLVQRAIEWSWSGAREYAGLSLAGRVQVGAGLALSGAFARSIAGPPLALGTAEQALVPSASPAVLLAATAQVFGVPVASVRGRGFGDRLRGARAAFVELGRLEGYPVHLLGPLIRRSRSSCYDILGGVPAGERLRAVRVARALLADPALRRLLPNVE